MELSYLNIIMHKCVSVCYVQKRVNQYKEIQNYYATWYAIMKHDQPYLKQSFVLPEKSLYRVYFFCFAHLRTIV